MVGLLVPFMLVEHSGTSFAGYRSVYCIWRW